MDSREAGRYKNRSKAEQTGKQSLERWFWYQQLLPMMMVDCMPICQGSRECCPVPSYKYLFLIIPGWASKHISDKRKPHCFRSAHRKKMNRLVGWNQLPIRPSKGLILDQSWQYRVNRLARRRRRTEFIIKVLF